MTYYDFFSDEFIRKNQEFYEFILLDSIDYIRLAAIGYVKLYLVFLILGYFI